MVQLNKVFGIRFNVKDKIDCSSEKEQLRPVRIQNYILKDISKVKDKKDKWTKLIAAQKRATAASEK